MPALLVILILVGIPGMATFLIAVEHGFNIWAVILLIVSILLFIILVFITVVISFFTIDFVLPIMYMRDSRITKAWKIFLQLFRSNIGSFLLYILMRVLLGSAALMIMMIPCCCLGLITLPLTIPLSLLGMAAFKSPWLFILLIPLGIIIWLITGILWQMVITPITVFFRTYPLIFLEGFGEEFLSIHKKTA